MIVLGSEKPSKSPFGCHLFLPKGDWYFPQFVECLSSSKALPPVVPCLLGSHNNGRLFYDSAEQLTSVHSSAQGPGTSLFFIIRHSYIKQPLLKIFRNRHSWVSPSGRSLPSGSDPNVIRLSCQKKEGVFLVTTHHPK